MSPEKQREAIAIICGYEQRPDGYWREVGMIGSCGIPDYLNSLDAMHEAEKFLPSAEACRNYSDILDDGNGGHFATAAQRAEAFLKTFNKWEDGE